MSRFDESFAARSSYVQPVASSSWMENVGVLGATGAVTGGLYKVFGAITMVLGAAVIVSGEPFSGFKLFAEGASMFGAGNFIKATVETYGESVGNRKSGFHESGTEVVERFGTNFKSGLLRL